MLRWYSDLRPLHLMHTPCPLTSPHCLQALPPSNETQHTSVQMEKLVSFGAAGLGVSADSSGWMAISQL